MKHSLFALSLVLSTLSMTCLGMDYFTHAYPAAAIDTTPDTPDTPIAPEVLDFANQLNEALYVQDEVRITQFMLQLQEKHYSVNQLKAIFNYSVARRIEVFQKEGIPTTFMLSVHQSESTVLNTFIAVAEQANMPSDVLITFITSREQKNNTPLSYAVSEGKKAIVELLLSTLHSHGADLTHIMQERDHTNETLLMKAARIPHHIWFYENDKPEITQKYIDIIHLLLEAEPTWHDANGEDAEQRVMDAIEYARASDYHKTTKSLSRPSQDLQDALNTKDALAHALQEKMEQVKETYLVQFVKDASKR